jgi:hypothetical protein
LSVVASLARATQVIYRTPQQLGTQSQLVVHGRVVSVESWWNEKHTKIFTTTRVAVDNAYKGSAPPAVDVIQLGGVVDNIRVTVSGSLQWAQGEEVLLFLEPYMDNFAVSGFSQGKFNVMRDENGKAYVKRPAIEGVQLLGAPSLDGKTAPTKTGSVSLEDFVNSALGRGGKGGAQ